jgi:hypothetical protein
VLGAISETSQQHASRIAVVLGSAEAFALGQQHAERTVPSSLHRYATRANAADGTRTINISRESAKRRTAR